MAITNSASAHWAGSLKDGAGTISTRSAALRGIPYDFRKRFEGAEGTNPEELIGAAHAACFSMALSAELGKAGLTAAAIDTTATVSLDAGTVTGIALATTVSVPGADPAAVTKAAEDAKAGCPISRLLAPGTAISLSVTVS
jgi:osmotically inducible protein OsmC